MGRWDREELVGPGFADNPRSSHAAHGRYYHDPAIFELEIDRVFRREWNYFCHESQIAEPGDYLVGEVGRQSLYVIRGRDGQVRSFYNVCQHRGHELLRGSGTIPNVVVCPYHAWSYDTEGALRGAPRMRQVPQFCKADVFLTPVRVEIIAGFVFVNLDEEATSLRELAPQFEPIVTSMVGNAGPLRVVRTRGYEIAANWKVVVENFLEAYHVEFSGSAHRALANIIDVDTYRSEVTGRTIEYLAKGGAPDVLPYQANEHDSFTDLRGAPFHQVFLYPNMTFSVFPGTNMLFVFNMRPDGPERCLEEIVYLALDSEMTDASRSAEAYISEQLNHEDIEIVEAVQRGIRSGGYRPGRLMVDENQVESWSEHFVHHFNMTHLSAIQRP